METASIIQDRFPVAGDPWRFILLSDIFWTQSTYAAAATLNIGTKHRWISPRTHTNELYEKVGGLPIVCLNSKVLQAMFKR